MTTLLRDRLDHWARVRPGAAAITFGEQVFTWGQWRERILRLTGALREAGVRPGDRVAVLDLNHLATVEVTLAASSLGAATVVANFRWSPDQVRYVLDDARPVVLFHGAQFAGAAAGVETRRVGIDGYEAVLAAAPPDEGGGAAPDDVCLILYTSGTTGRPKGAELTHRGITETTRSPRSAASRRSRTAPRPCRCRCCSGRSTRGRRPASSRSTA